MKMKLHSANGVGIWAASRNYVAGKYACYALSSGPICPFFECWAVVDDFGNLVTV